MDEEHLRRDASQTLLRGWLSAAAEAPRWQLLDLPPASAGLLPFTRPPPMAKFVHSLRVVKVWPAETK